MIGVSMITYKITSVGYGQKSAHKTLF